LGCEGAYEGVIGHDDDDDDDHDDDDDKERGECLLRRK
jgi:hypothetical protein